ncbi:MAG: DsrE family protein [Candidatus Bathyarchaeia archaeon]
MKLLLYTSTARRLQHLIGLTLAASERGHKVSIFLNTESVSLLREERLREVGGYILVCRTSAVKAGIEKEELYCNSRMSSLGELVELIDESDKVVFLG